MPEKTTQIYSLSIANQIEGRTVCAFGEAAAWPVQSFIEKFKDEFEDYPDNGTVSSETGEINNSFDFAPRTLKQGAFI